MRCQIVKNNGEVIGLDMSWLAILNGPGRLGEIHLDAGPGVTRIIPKASISDIYQFTDDAWKKAQEDAETQKKEQEKRRAEHDAKVKADAAAETLKLLESKTLRGRIRKLFGKAKPVKP